MAKYLLPSDVGNFGVFQSGVMYAVYLVGLDFYAYSTRELVADYPRICGKKIGSQIVIYIFSYLIVAPIMLGVFVSLGFAWWLSIVAIFFVFLEHANQEMVRMIEAFGQPVLAGNLTILRSSVWAIIGVLAIVFIPSQRNMNSILAIWATFGLISTVITILIVRKKFPIAGHLGVDWEWLKKGLKIAGLFFIGTLAVRALFTADKFTVKILSEVEVPAYILFSAFGVATLTVVEASVFAFYYPKMLRCTSNLEVLRELVKKSSIQSFIVGFILSSILLITMHPLLNVIGHNAYIKNIEMAPLILLSIFIYALGLGPHYGLYAMKMDRIIVTSQLSGIFVFLLLANYLGVLAGAKGVIFSQIVAFLVITSIKSVYFYNHTKFLAKG